MGTFHIPIALSKVLRRACLWPYCVQYPIYCNDNTVSFRARYHAHHPDVRRYLTSCR